MVKSSSQKTDGGQDIPEPPADPPSGRKNIARIRRSIDYIEGLCTKCRLHTQSYVTSNQTLANNIDGFGSSSPDVMVVFEVSPVSLDGTGMPAHCNTILSKLRKKGVQAHKVRFSGCLRCPGPEITIQSECFNSDNKELFKQCKDYLLDEIEDVNPKVVLLVGPGTWYSALGKLDTYGQRYAGSIVKKHERVYILTHSWYKINNSTYAGAEFMAHLNKILPSIQGTLIEEDLTYKIVCNSNELDKTVEFLRNKEYLVFDFETDSKLDSQVSGFSTHDKLLGIGFSWAPKRGVFIPLDHRESIFNGISEAKSAVREILSNPSKKIAHNALFDCYAAFYFLNGVKVNNLFFDTMLAHHVIDPTRGTHGLKYLAMMYSSMGGYEEEIQEQLEAVPKEERTYGKIKLQDLWKYCLIDCDLTFRFFLKFNDELDKNPNLRKVFDKITMPSYHMMFDLKTQAWNVDEDKLTELETYYQNKKDDLKSFITTSELLKGTSFINGINLNSPQQLSKLLFTELELPHNSKTKKNNPSTDKHALTELASICRDSVKPKEKNATELVQSIVMFKQYEKTLNTFLKGLRKHVIEGKIFTDYLIHSTETGRLSSRKPNMQQIPGEFEGVPKDKKIKSIFSAPQGYKFLQADYSQIELRNLANLTGEPFLIDAFKNGIDLHRETGKIITGSEDVPEHIRQLGKTLNFAMCYGASPGRLAAELRDRGKWTKLELATTLERLGYNDATKHINSYRKSSLLRELAVSLIKRMRDRWPVVITWQEKIGNKVTRDPKHMITSPFGRRRFLAGGNSTYEMRHMLNQTYNYPIQSASSDCLLLGAISLNNALKNKYSYIVGSVHDSVILYAKEGELEEVVALTKTHMEKAPVEYKPEFFKIPLKVDIQIGPNWADLKEVKI